MSASNAGDLGSIPGSGRSPGEGHGHPLQYSCWENCTDGGAWWATVHGVTKSQTRLSDLPLCMSTLLEWPRLSLACGPRALGQEALSTAQPPASMQTSSFLRLGSAPGSAPSTCAVPYALVSIRCPPPSSSIREALTSQARPLPAQSRLSSMALTARTGSPLAEVPSTASSGSEPPSQSSSSPRHDTSLGPCELMPEQPRVWGASNTAWHALGRGCLLTPLGSNTRCQPAPTPQSLLHPPGDLTPHVQHSCGSGPFTLLASNPLHASCLWDHHADATEASAPCSEPLQHSHAAGTVTDGGREN